MASYQQFTLWTLPDQPLPRSELKDPVFVTVWLFLCLLFAAILRHLLNKTINPTWQEFRTTMLGTLFLAFWYIITAIDRWLRYDGRAVKYGYIIIAPIWESFRVTSTILLLWGTYTVVWKELEDHFSPRQQGIWWFAAKFALFIVALMSIFYVVLYLALSVVWMEFFSLNVIADIATKRTGFEIAMTAFFMAFGLLTLAEATAALVIGALKVHGHMEATRLFLWLAALLLFARSTAEFAIITNVYSSSATRQSTQLAADIAYGLITVLYLAMMCCMAKVAASTFDRGGRQAKMVASDIRQWVLQRLDEVTNGARKESPAFETIIRQAEENLNNVLANGPLTSGLMELNQAYKEQAARDCIALLRGEFGKLNPKEGAEYTSRPATGFSSLFGRRSKSTQILNASTATLTSGTTHPTASNSSATTGTSQPSASTGATLFEDPRGFGRAPSTVSSVPGPPRPINLNRPAAPGPQNTGHGNTSRFVPSLGTFPEQSISPQSQQQQQQPQPQQHRYSPPPIQQTQSNTVPNGHSVRDYSATHELLPIATRPVPPVVPTSTASSSNTPSQWTPYQSALAGSPEYSGSNSDTYRTSAALPIAPRGASESSAGSGSRPAVPNVSTYNPSARWSASSSPEPPRPIQRPRDPQAPTQQPQQQSYQSPQSQPEPTRYTQPESSRYPPSSTSPVPRPIPPPSSAASSSPWASSAQSYSSPQSSYAYPALVNPPPTVLPYFSDRNTSARNSPVPRPIPPPTSASRTYTSPTPVAPPSMSPTPMAPRPIPPPSALYSTATTSSYPAVSGGWLSTPSSTSAQPVVRSRAAEDLPHDDIYEH